MFKNSEYDEVLDDNFPVPYVEGDYGIRHYTVCELMCELFPNLNKDIFIKKFALWIYEIIEDNDEPEMTIEEHIELLKNCINKYKGSDLSDEHVDLRKMFNVEQHYETETETDDDSEL